jgi:hypothetical protein
MTRRSDTESTAMPTTPTWADRALAVLGRADWPYGVDRPAEGRLIEWAERHGLRCAPRGRCLHWLTRGRCSENICCRAGHLSLPWMDHLTGWTRNGKTAVLLAQPYQHRVGALADMERATEQWDIKITIDEDGWYGRGTVAVMMMPRSAEIACCYEEHRAKVSAGKARAAARRQQFRGFADA